jgi:hypothetical protein
MKLEIDYNWLVLISFLLAMFCNFLNSFLGKLENTWISERTWENIFFSTKLSL